MFEGQRATVGYNAKLDLGKVVLKCFLGQYNF